MSFQKSGQKIFMILPKNSYTIIFATFAKTPQGVSSTIHHLIHAEARKRMWKVVKKTPAMRPSTTSITTATAWRLMNSQHCLHLQSPFP